MDYTLLESDITALLAMSLDQGSGDKEMAETRAERLRQVVRSHKVLSNAINNLHKASNAGEIRILPNDSGRY